MSTHKASTGLMKIGSDILGELTDMSIEQSADMIESTQMSDSTKSFVSGQTSWTCSATCHWDEGDTAQEALTVGASITINFYPEGATTGDIYGTGAGLVSSVGVASTKNGIVSRTFSMQGTAGVTWAAIT